MNWILNRMFEPEIQRQAAIYLDKVGRAMTEASRTNATKLLARLRNEAGPEVVIGETMWGEPVSMPLSYILRSHGFMNGATGSGKTATALIITEKMMELAPRNLEGGFGVLDLKGENDSGVKYQISQRLKQLAARDPGQTSELRQRTVIIGFSNRHARSSYNILCRRPDEDADYFASNRADLLLDLLPGGEKPSLGGRALLRKLILLLSDPAVRLPITRLCDILHDERFRNRALARCRDASVREYFARQFCRIPGPTVAAIDRRIDALFCSAGVRLVLSGDTVPDFSRLQDEGKFILICIGQGIPRSIRQLLQCIIVSDIAASVFRRRKRNVPFLWFLDEAQNLFANDAVRDRIGDLHTMSRSFGSHFLCMMQNADTAISDPRMLRTMLTNIRWAFTLRSGPGDAAFLKPALPVTGRKLRPQADPFGPASFLSLSEERAAELDAINSLPEREGYLWLKAMASEAIRIRTRELRMPRGEELEKAVSAIERDATIGGRLSRKEYEHVIAERDRKWNVEEESDVGAKLRLAYRKGDGGRDEEAR